MKRTATSPSDRDLAVALLYCTGASQKQIAFVLHISQSEVSRALGRVEKEYIQPMHPRFRAEMLSRERLAAVTALTAPRLRIGLRRLSEACGHSFAPTLRVINLRCSEASVSAFAREAGIHVRDLICRASVSTVGVTWGYILWCLTEAIRTGDSTTPWRKEGPPIEIVPLGGDPLDSDDTGPQDITSSRIAAELGRLVNGPKYTAPWLGLCPAYLPPDFTKQEKAVLRKLIAKISDYKQIFDPNGLAWRMDACVTSVGRASNPLGFGRNGCLLGKLGEQLPALTAGIHGDIGGVLLPKQTAKLPEIVQTVGDGWTGLKMEHLQACVRQAQNSDPQQGRPGVILLGYEADPERIEAIYQSIKLGLVNVLVLELDCLHALELYIDKRLEDGEFTRQARV